MVGLVIVSHSYTLAQGVLELVSQMASAEVKIATAGGMDVPEHDQLGTDPFLVQRAIESVYHEDGVLVLMDLGSAILSAEMALDFLSEGMRPQVLLCEAPLVEGALAAAVQAGLGSPLDVVAAEARSALLPKASQLGIEAPQVPDTVQAPVATAAEVSTLRLTIHNPLGLHARPAAQFVQTAGRFAADISVRNLTRGGPAVNARSINLVTTQGIRRGHEIEITAGGPQAQEALDALRALAEAGFGEDDITPGDEVPVAAPRPAAESLAPAAGERVLQGIAASPGTAIGPAHLLARGLPALTRVTVRDPALEWERLRAAIDTVRGQITQTRDRLAKQVSGYDAAIFEAHLLFLDDPALVGPARSVIEREHINADAAWQGAYETMAAAYEGLEDAYLAARAADVRDVGRQVLAALAGEAAPVLNLTQPAVLLAADLSPGDTANLDRDRVLAICTAAGGPTSHSAILARSLGIPAVVGLGPALLGLPAGTPLVVDGDRGAVVVAPGAERLADAQARRTAWLAGRDRAAQTGQLPAVTRDGRRMEVVANIGSLADARRALAAGAEGVGLLRTEFLFLDRQTAPGEAEQYDLLRPIFELMGQRPVVVRTLDVGGDKDLAYVDLGHEANPFLGTRAVRLYQERPDLIRPQLAAILRAGAGHPTRIMFPMIASREEILAVRATLAEVQESLARAGRAVADDLQVGIMIEVPAAAVLADRLAAVVDFFSIGTNDLTQYTMAAERGNPRLAHLADALHPAVLRLIAGVVEAAHRQGRWVGVCGELAGDPAAVPVLLGLDVDELSMNPAAVSAVKEQLRGLHAADCRRLAADLLQCASADEVRAVLRAETSPAG